MPSRSRRKPSDIERWRRNYDAEQEAAYLYRELAKAEKNADRSSIYLRLAEAEERHSSIWEERLRGAGALPAAARPGLKARMLGRAARLFGSESILPIVTTMELRDAGSYGGQEDAAALIPEERAHARIFSRLSGEAVDAPTDIARRERWHRVGGVGGTGLRAAVFGVNDGLVSNVSLVMGVAGANPDNSFILLAGVAGLLAGAFSMASGEYVSVRAQRELYERQIELERRELEENPEEEKAELALIYELKGIPRPEAERLAQRLVQDPEVALDTLVREELGLDPNELGGSPFVAAASSFVAFALGAVVPVAPYVFTEGDLAFGLSAGLSALVISAVGALLSLFTARNPLVSGGRMLLLGAAAAAATFGIGKAIGVNTG
jgi:VIT1/CCC1 family predicted Fe2+/Mn2+ transporter